VTNVSRKRNGEWQYNNTNKYSKRCTSHIKQAIFKVDDTAKSI